MTLDKKSIIQVVVLLVLIVGGGFVYLSSQDESFDPIGSIMGLIGGEEPQPSMPMPAPRPTPSAKAAEPTIPAQPVKGSVAGNPFDPESIVFEGGVLALVQSKEPQTAVLVSVDAPKWETPAGKKFKYLPAAADSPAVVVSRNTEGQMTAQTHTDKYSLVLEFGKENGGKLPGKLHLQIPGGGNSTLAGTFDAEIKGFRFVDGKPDLTADSTDTLQYLALRELLKDDPDKPLDVVAFRDGRYGSEGAGKKSTGYIEVAYRAGKDAPTQTKRYQFVKDAEWKIRGTLSLDQIDEAHPLAVPGAKDRPEQQLNYLAAKRLEADAKKKSPKQGVYGVTLLSRFNAKQKIGTVEATYKNEPEGASVKTAYLFRLKGSAWALDRELKANEKVNVDTGKIEKK